jgi:hypothetical protein
MGQQVFGQHPHSRTYLQHTSRFASLQQALRHPLCDVFIFQKVLPVRFFSVYFSHSSFFATGVALLKI